MFDDPLSPHRHLADNFALRTHPDHIDSPSARMARETFDSPSARMARETFDSPSARMAREMFDSPSARMAREMLDSPSARIAREMLDSPSARIAREMFDSPSARMAREMFDSPSARMAREMLDGPSARIAREMFDNPAARMAREMFDSPAARMAREMAETPAMQIAREMIDSPSMRMAREMARQMTDSPSMRSAQEMARQMIDSPSMRIAREMARGLSVSDALHIGGTLVGTLPQALVGSLVASELVNAARAEGVAGESLDQTLTLEAFANADFSLESDTSNFVSALSAFLSGLTKNVRKYLAAAHTQPELAGLMQHVMLLLAFAAVYYSAQSATTVDIVELKKTVEHQTEVIQRVGEAGRSSARALENQFREAVEEVGRLFVQKQTELPLRQLYVAKRAVPVKAEKAMTSPTVGEVSIGDFVSIRRVDGKWIEFDYFDYSQGRALHGWAVKKYFRRVK